MELGLRDKTNSKLSCFFFVVTRVQHSRGKILLSLIGEITTDNLQSPRFGSTHTAQLISHGQQCNANGTNFKKDP